MAKKIRKQLTAQKIDLPVKQLKLPKPELDQATEIVTDSKIITQNSISGESVYNTPTLQNNTPLPNIYENPNVESVSNLGEIDTTIPQSTSDDPLNNINEAPNEKSNEPLPNVNGIPNIQTNESLPNIYGTPKQKQTLGNLNVNDPTVNSAGSTSLGDLNN